jgi:hypothetical protein
MNRAERRKMQRKMKGNNIILPKGIEPPRDRKKDFFCYRHQLKLDDPNNPNSERDKRLIESVRYETIKQDLDDGTTRIYKKCPRCLDTVEIDIIKKPLLAE